MYLLRKMKTFRLTNTQTLTTIILFGLVSLVSFMHGVNKYYSVLNNKNANKIDGDFGGELASNALLRTQESCLNHVPVSHLKSFFSVVGYNWTRSPDCTEYAACALNEGRAPVRTFKRPPGLPESEKTRPLHDVVTVVIKTVNRFGVLRRLIESIYQFYPALKIIVIGEIITGDRNTTAILRKEYKEWQNFSWPLRRKLAYIVLANNTGISRGRNVGLAQVRTKYFLLLDDDMIFVKETNISKLRELLDHTDLAVVGGLIKDTRIKMAIHGIFRIHAYQYHKAYPHINEYHLMAYERLACYPTCHVIDMTSNFFLARTDAILDMGGWDNRLRVGEHRDFMLTLRKNNHSIAVCTDIIIEHFPPNLELRKKAQKDIQETYKDIFLQKWKIGASFDCNKGQAYYEYRCKP